MSKECAFCPETANLSLEHLWSNWMGDLFPGKKRFTNMNEHGEIVADWSSEKLDWKARVVCETCNNTWMSEIETKHAMPAINNFIVGKTARISQTCADSIALFAFKTAVVIDHIRREREPFFSQSVRHGFRKDFAIPATVRMFMAGFLPGGKGRVLSCYQEGGLGALSATDRITLYVCTYAVGHFVFQVVGQKQQGFTTVTLEPRGPRTFHSFAVEFWPWIPDGVEWPPTDVLQTVGDFDSFSNRWQNLTATSHSTAGR